MKLLSRYLAREIYASVFLVFAALLMLFALIDLINQLNEMGRGDYRLGFMLLYVALILPGHIYELFPVAVLIGTIVALVQLAASSELTVYRASGVSLKQLIQTLLRIGAPLLLACFVIGEFVAPPSEKLAQQIKLKAQNAQVNVREFRSGVWVKDEGSFVNVRSVLPDTSLLNVSIYQFDENYHLVSVTAAKRATFLEERRWQLEDVQRTVFEGVGARAESLPSMEWHTALNPSLLNVLMVMPEQMSAWNLYQYTRHLADNKQSTLRYEIALWNKMVYPFAVFVMMMLALPFSSYQRREGGVGGKIFLGVVLGLAFHFASRLFANLGTLNEWPAMFSATAVSWIFLGVALFLLWRTERR